MIPEGLTLKCSSDMPYYEPTKSYLLRIKERLRSDAGIIAADDPNLNPVFHIPPQHPITQGPQDQYGEIVIGNEPGT